MSDAKGMQTMIDRELARRAYSGISMTPDRRADQAVAEFEGTVEALRQQLYRIAGDDLSLRAAADGQVAEFRTRYAAKYSDWLSALSRCMSSMITGPSNFPVRRNQKRLDTEHRRLEELLDFKRRAQAAAIKAVRAARSPEQVQDEELTALLRRIDEDMVTVAEIDAGRSPYTRSAFTTSVTGRLERLARNGKAHLVRQALVYIKEKQAGQKKPFLAARNGVWKLAEVAEAKAAEPVPEGEKALGEYTGPCGARVVNNYDEERVQIYFDAIPPAAVRQALGAEGWNFSRRNGNAWQRKNTNAAEWSADRILKAQGFVRAAREAEAGGEG
jgi:hypothetical protein